MVGDVGTTITQFVTRWVQTPSNYDTLVATTMHKDWVHKHQPVISQHSTGHQLYDRFSVERPKGMPVVCHRRECKQIIQYRIHSDEVRMACPGCLSTTRIPKILPDRDNILSNVGIVRVEYPPRDYPAQWWFPQDGPLNELARPPAKTIQIETRRPKEKNKAPPWFGYRPCLKGHLPVPFDHRSSQMSCSISLNTLLTPTPTLQPVPSSSSLRVTVPPRNPAITRSQSTPSMRNQSATPTPPPQSPYEQSPTASEGKRALAEVTYPYAQKKRKPSPKEKDLDQ